MLVAASAFLVTVSGVGAAFQGYDLIGRGIAAVVFAAVELYALYSLDAFWAVINGLIASFILFCLCWLVPTFILGGEGRRSPTDAGKPLRYNNS